MILEKYFNFRSVLRGWFGIDFWLIILKIKNKFIQNLKIINWILLQKSLLRMFIFICFIKFTILCKEYRISLESLSFILNFITIFAVEGYFACFWLARMLIKALTLVVRRYVHVQRYSGPRVGLVFDAMQA